MSEISILRIVRNRQSDNLANISWQDFETLLARYYQDQGYRVEHMGTAGTQQRFDGGVDLKLYKDDDYILVQCKHWNAKQVPHNDVHQLIGLKVNESATGAVLVTSGEFTQAAKTAASKGSITLMDGVELREKLGYLLPDDVSSNVVSIDSPHNSSATASINISKLLLMLILLVLSAAVLWWAWATFNTALNDVAKTSVAKPVVQPQPAASPPSNATQTLETNPQQAIPVPQPTKPQPIAEIGMADEMMSKQELAEWKKKNAESMKVLERLEKRQGK